MSPVKTDPGNLPILLLTASDAVVPALIAARGRHAGRRFVEFFTANIRNPNTRKAYYRAACEFFDWCDQARLVELLDIEPVHIAAWVEDIGRRFAPPTVKQWLAAVRMLFDWLVVGQVLAVNPAAAVRGPKYVVRTGKTPVLGALEARQLLDSIDTGTVGGLRDRALIGLLVFTFARIGAALSMTVADIYWQHRRLWVRLHEKGGKEHAMPCHHNLETYLQDYIEAAGLASDREGVLFRTSYRRTGVLTDRAMTQSDAWRMLARGTPVFRRRSAITPSAPPASPPISTTAARSKTLRPWPLTRVRAPPNSTIARMTRSPLMK